MSIEGYVLSLFKRKRLYWVIIIFIIIAAFFRIPELQIWLLPKLKPSKFFVVTEFPNHSAEDTDLMVSLPISEMVSSVKSVERIRTISEHGKSIVQIDLRFGASLSEFKDQLYQTIFEMKDKLPFGVGSSLVSQGDAIERPFMEILIPKGNWKKFDSSDFHLKQLQFQLERISGVTEVRMFGKPQHSSFISINSNVFDLFPISIRDLEFQIQAAIQGGSLGKIDGYTNDTELKFAAEILTHKDLLKFPIYLGNGNSVPLGRLATVFESELPSEKLTRIDQKDSIYIAIYSDPSSNPLRVSSEVQTKLQILDSELNPHIFYDGSTELRNQLHQFGINIVWGLVFAFLFSYLLYRNWIPAIILFASVFFSLVLFFHFLLLFSISINLLSLGGISVGIGMLFDASNLTVFSIRKQLNKQSILGEAVSKGIRSILISLVSSSFTTIVVFIPLLVFPIKWKDFFFDSSVCIALLVFCSLISSLLIVPLLSLLFADSLRERKENLNRETYLFQLYKRSHDFLNRFCNRRFAIFTCFILFFGVFSFGAKWEVFPKQPSIGIRLQLSPRSNLSLQEELTFIYDLEQRIKHFDPRLSILVVPLNLRETKHQHPQKTIPIELKLMRAEKIKELETFLADVLSGSNWDWKLDSIQSEVSTALPFVSTDSIVFLHESWDELRNFTSEFARNNKLMLDGGFDFYPKKIYIEELSRNQIPVAELIPNETDFKQKYLYQQIPKYLGSIGETKQDLYLGIDSLDISLRNKKEIKKFSFKTKANDLTYVGSLFQSKMKESFDQYRREYGLFYMEWIGELSNINSLSIGTTNGLSLIKVSVKKEVGIFFLSLFVLLFLSFVFIYLSLVGIYESFGIPLFYLGISFFYLSITTFFVFLLFNTFHLGHYIGLIVLLGLSIDSISLFGERWIDCPENFSFSGRMESVFRWLLWPIFLNSGTTMMGFLPAIVFSSIGSEFTRSIALTMFVGIPVSVFFTFYIYPILFNRYLVRLQ